MSRLNYLSDDELALDGIDQNLRLLERLVSEGMTLNQSQAQTLAQHCDRIKKLVMTGLRAETANPGTALENNALGRQSTPQSDKAGNRKPSTELLRRSVGQCFGHKLT
jgi:hypothetical protein